MVAKSDRHKGTQKPLKVKEAAQLLGVHRGYLSMVLHGKMKSESLMRRYSQLKSTGQVLK